MRFRELFRHDRQGIRRIASKFSQFDISPFFAAAPFFFSRVFLLSPTRYLVRLCFRARASIFSVGREVRRSNLSPRTPFSQPIPFLLPRTSYFECSILFYFLDCSIFILASASECTFVLFIRGMPVSFVRLNSSCCAVSFASTSSLSCMFTCDPSTVPLVSCDTANFWLR